MHCLEWSTGRMCVGTALGHKACVWKEHRDPLLDQNLSLWTRHRVNITDRSRESVYNTGRPQFLWLPNTCTMVCVLSHVCFSNTSAINDRATFGRIVTSWCKILFLRTIGIKSSSNGSALMLSPSTEHTHSHAPTINGPPKSNPYPSHSWVLQRAVGLTY